MSQKKSSGKSTNASRASYRAPQHRGGYAGRSSHPGSGYGQEDTRRRYITLGIIGAGVLIALLVVVMSVEQRSPSPVAGQPGANVQATESQIAAFQQRLTQNPADLDAIVGLGDTYYDARRYTEAIPWYEKAIEKAPTNTDIRTDLGTAYFYSGNNEKAKEHWFKALEQDPNKVQTHFNLGVLYSSLTPPDTASAAKEYETVIRIAPNSADAKEAEARLKKMGKR